LKAPASSIARLGSAAAIRTSLYGSGGTVVEVTRSVLYDNSGKPMFTVRYMTLWQNSAGRWRIHRQIAIPI
jgi:hypothetical protein